MIPLRLTGNTQQRNRMDRTRLTWKTMGEDNVMVQNLGVATELTRCGVSSLMCLTLSKHFSGRQLYVQNPNLASRSVFVKLASRFPDRFEQPPGDDDDRTRHLDWDGNVQDVRRQSFQGLRRFLWTMGFPSMKSPQTETLRGGQ